MAFQHVLGVGWQTVRKVHVKLHYEISSLLRVLGKGQPLSCYGLPHSWFDDLRDLHIARFPVYRGDCNRATAQRLESEKWGGWEKNQSLFFIKTLTFLHR